MEQHNNQVQTTFSNSNVQNNPARWSPFQDTTQLLFPPCKIRGIDKGFRSVNCEAQCYTPVTSNVTGLEDKHLGGQYSQLCDSGQPIQRTNCTKERLPSLALQSGDWGEDFSLHSCPLVLSWVSGLTLIGVHIWSFPPLLPSMGVD
jgi:hypothetical protein